MIQKNGAASHSAGKSRDAGADGENERHEGQLRGLTFENDGANSY